MAFALSVIICTHNPRTDYLTRALAALGAQTLSTERWEFLLIDNASAEPIAARFDLGWHPHGRHVREDELGLTPARLRGIAEATANTLVFVDDDNLLCPDYLEQVLRIGAAWPMLGTWGGQAVAEYEVEPGPNVLPHVSMLAVRMTDRDSWTNVAGAWNEAYPIGAGLCIRKVVADRYAELVATDPTRRSLDRTGTHLVSGGDYDLNLVSCESGYGCGVFRALQLTHLIPVRRVSEEYLVALWRGHAYSNTLLLSVRGRPPVDPLGQLRNWIMCWLRSLRMASFDRRLTWAHLRGTHEALKAWRASQPAPETNRPAVHPASS